MLNWTRCVAVNPQCSRIGWEGEAGLLRGDSAKRMSIEMKDHSWVSCLSKEFLDGTNICASGDVLHISAEIKQTLSRFTSRTHHWLLMVGHRASLWTKVEAVNDFASQWFWVCAPAWLVCFQSSWGLGLLSNWSALVTSHDLEATVTLCWETCGMRTANCVSLSGMVNWDSWLAAGSPVQTRGSLGISDPKWTSGPGDMLSREQNSACSCSWWPESPGKQPGRADMPGLVGLA